MADRLPVMPFFLSSKPAQKPPRAKTTVADKTKAKPNQTPRDLTWLWLILSLLLCVGLACGWYFARQSLRAHLAARAPVPVGARALHLEAFGNTPWVSQADVQQLVRDMGERLSPNPLDGESLAHAADVLAKHPAIRQVKRIWRDQDGLVRIEALAYQPAGLVEEGTTLSAVDGEGHLLAAALSSDLKLPIPRIQGVRSASPYGKDAVWKDAGLQAALKLILRLPEADRRRLRKLVLGEEFSGKHPRTTLTLFLQVYPEQTLEVLWGLPIGEEAGIDASCEVKLKSIHLLCANQAVLKQQIGTQFSIRSGSPMALASKPALPTPASTGRKP